jgi:subtilisin family serine protease
MARRVVAVLAACMILVGQAGAALAAANPGPRASAAPVEGTLLAALASGKANQFVVEFSAQPDLRGAARIRDHGARGDFVFATLTGNAKRSQAAAIALAKKAGAKATSYWLTNSLIVTGNATLAKEFSKLAGVMNVRAEKVYPLVKPVDAKAAILAAAGDPEWGVEKIRADESWADGVIGQGVVVANVDTGVDYTHPALVNQYRGNLGSGEFDHNYNWWDPTGICGEEPCDNAEHGTHTMGTIVGGDGPGPFTPDIGVAPGARWIAAKGCEDFSCSEEALLSSGQFILAPTDSAGENPDPSLRPDIVNNSWGSGPGDPFYLEIVQAWRAAGIIPVFSSGNPGPFCGEGGSPGDFLESFSAGATDVDDEIADFSGRGPSAFGKINPDISAPGVDVVSSVPGGGYAAFSGTSMAAPHTTGTLALVLSAKPALIGDPDNYGPLTDGIKVTALDRIDMACGGADDGDPNNVYGDGRIDAKAAVDLVATGGTLAGTVTRLNGTPIPGAQVTAAGGFRDFTVTTDAAGHYEMFLAAGTYTVSAVAFGFAVKIVPGVVIVADQTTTQNFALRALPRFRITGHVRAAEDGSPLVRAHVQAIGTPVAPARTDRTGAYQLILPIGTYTLRASAGGCTETGIAEGVELVDHDITVDFSLGRKLDVFGHGCRAIAFNWVDATTQTALFGDEFAGRLHLPFAFSFYGESYETVYISDNGYLNFLGPDQFNQIPLSIPSEGPPNAAIYALWRDLHINEESIIEYATLGSPGSRTLVLELTDIAVMGATSTVDVEIKLYERGETVDILYGNNAANPGDGRGATIGIEDATGTDALEFSFSESLIVPNTGYRYELVPSGIVHGRITDRNDGEPISGATVSASPGLGSTKTDVDGFYSLRLYPGRYTVTASATNYVSKSNVLTLVDGAELTRNFRLNAPVPTVDPAEVAVELAFGAEPTTSVVTLSNTGSALLTWEAKERSRGSSPPVIDGEAAGTGAWRQDVRPAVRLAVNGGGTALAHPKAFRWTAAEPTADMSILVYADDPIHPAPETFVDQALQRLGLSYTAHYEGDFGGFKSDLESGSWDLVIFANDNFFPDDFSIFDSLNAYVEGGGRLILHTWVVEADPSHPLWARLGFAFAESNFDPPNPVFWWQPEHPAFTFPEVVPELTELDGQIFGIYGQRGDPLEGAEAIAGYTTPGPDDGQAALILANGDRTAFRGFLDGQNSADLDGDGVLDGVELWEDLATGVGSGFFVDLPWLSESPVTGTLAAGASQQVTLTIDPSGLAPGEYRGSVVFLTNAPKPRTVTVNVTLTVALPDSWGAVSGRVIDAHSPELEPEEPAGIPIPGVTVTLHTQWAGAPLDISATTDRQGMYTLVAPSGTWPLEFSKTGWVSLTRDETVVAGVTTTVADAALHELRPHGTVEWPPLDFLVTPGDDAHGTITIANPDGHADLTFEIGEVNVSGPALPGVTGTRPLVRVADPDALTTKGANRPAVKLPPGIRATGDILDSWPTVGLDLPWGVGFTGNVWISDPVEGGGDLCSQAGVCLDTEFTQAGVPTGLSFETTFGDWAADMAFDRDRNLLWQVSVGGDNGIYGLDPADGSVEMTITGDPWDNISQRGLAYDATADVFYIGGWNEGIVYRVAGPSHPTPGETLGQCQPADPSISGLAWNGSFRMLWASTNSETDTIYLLDPETCEASMALAHPTGGFSGAGLELDAVGNLWTVSQGGQAYLIESGLPIFSDAPWLTVTPETGTVAPDASTELDVHVDSAGLAPGVYRAIVVVQTNDPDLGNVQVPVTLLVPAYQQGINAGGALYVDPATGIDYVSDQAFTPGGFGYVGGTTRSTRGDIAGTDRDPLYRDLRTDMSHYRFTVPNGTYRVDLSFAELRYARVGARVFSVAFENIPLIWQLDVVEAAGGRFVAHDRTVVVEVTDGVLDLEFVAQRGDDPIVNGILVSEIPGP